MWKDRVVNLARLHASFIRCKLSTENLPIGFEGTTSDFNRNPTSWPLSQTPFIFSSSLTITPWQSQSQWRGEKLMIKVWSICLNVSVCENLSRATLPCRSPLANSPSYVSLPDLSSQHDLINVLNPPIGNNLIHQIIRSSAFCCWERCESALTYQQ